MVVIGGTILLHELFASGTSHQSAAWSSAIEAASTVILVAVTVVYVIFTWQLVRLQADVKTPALTGQQVVAAGEAAKALAEAEGVLASVMESFPFTDASTPSWLAMTEWGALQRISEWLRGLQATLDPRLSKHCADTVQALSAASVAQRSLFNSRRDASMRQRQNVGPGEQAWGWSDARAIYETQYADSGTWDDLREGKLQFEAVTAVGGFQTAVTSYLANDRSLSRA